MNTAQSIQRPFGINVFGSAVLRVEPDMALLQFIVSRLEQEPKDAFAATHQAARSVRDYLLQVQEGDVASSRLTLSKQTRFEDGKHHFVGFLARTEVHFLLRDLDHLEDTLIGVVDAGVNEIKTVIYRTSRMRDLRAQARRNAVAAAREKAELYCEAAGVALGAVVHIEDVNPNSITGSAESHDMDQTALDDATTSQTFVPESIVIRAAVRIAFELAT